MRRSAAILCQQASSLGTLKTVLTTIGIDPVACHTAQEAIDEILRRQCAALIVDFDEPGAAEVASLPALFEPLQRPLLLAMTTNWPGCGQAFQSGANRILYKPLSAAEVKDAFEPVTKSARRDPRNAPRYQVTSVVWLELSTGTLPAVAVNLSEHGMAIRATEPLRVQSNVSFRCSLPGTEQIRGHADIIWSDADGRAGMFFSRLSAGAQKHLKDWLRLREKTSHCCDKTSRSGRLAGRTSLRSRASSVRDLLPPSDFAVTP